MKCIGEPITQVEVWIECEYGHIANQKVVVAIDNQRYVVIKGTCECGRRVEASFALNELRVAVGLIPLDEPLKGNGLNQNLHPQ